MKNINLNNNIKSQLNKHSVPSDHDAIWSNVHAELIKRKRRKRFLFLFVLPLSLAFLFTPFYIWQQSSLDSSDSIDLLKEVNSVSKHSMASIKVDEKQAIKNSIEDEILITNKDKIVESKKYIPSKKAEIINSILSSKTYLNKKNDKGKNDILVDLKIPEIISIVNIDQLKTNTHSNLNAVTKLIFNSSIATLDSKILYNTTYNLVASNTRNKSDLSLQLISSWQIGFYFSPGLFTSNITSIQNNDHISSVAANRSKYETPVEELSFGTEIVYNFDKNWSLSTGIEYSKLVEKFEASYSDTTTEFHEDVLLGIIIRSQNQLQPEKIIGTAPVTTIKSAYQKTYNRYHILSLPLLLKYNLNFGKLYFGVHGGLNLQSLFSVNGQAFDSNGLSALANNKINDQKVYSSKFHISPIAGLNLTYNFTNNLSMYVAPEFIANLNGLADQSSGIKHSVNRYRLRIGARFSM